MWAALSYSQCCNRNSSSITNCTNVQRYQRYCTTGFYMIELTIWLAEGYVHILVPNGAVMMTSCSLFYSNLDGNPLRCDCQLRWLPSFLESLPPLTTVTTGSCNSPPTLSGTNAGTLTESQLVCGRYSSTCCILFLISSLCIPYLVPDCDPTCVNGTCDLLVGDCRCEDGYIGEDCGTGIQAHSQPLV